MKFKFSKNLEYQLEAINAVVGIFDTGRNIAHGESEFKLQSGMQIVANELEMSKERILRNVQAIQTQNKIPQSALLKEDGGYLLQENGDRILLENKENIEDFSVEMETGTGKTYVYLRTIFELNQKYSLKKFIILVPSVAIREGVLKTLEQTREHFRELYNTGCGYFAYESEKLSQVRDFAQSNDIQIMIMTIQSFAGNERLVMRQTPDRFHGERPIDLIAETRPVVIMDEPQNMESELSKAAIADLKPLCKLRYSATHKEPHNLLFRLTPIDAYKQNLVKQIQVYGVQYLDPSELLFKVRSIEIKNRKPIAEVLIERKHVNGKYTSALVSVKAGDALEQKSGHNEKYAALTVTDVNKQHDFVELSNGEQYRMEGEVHKEDIFRAQVSETIKAHFLKQQQVGERIKVLSLFFIDKVDNYVHGGLVAKIFEEEFERMKKNYSYFRDLSAQQVHAGYFASKKVRGETVFQDTRGDSKIDKEAYDLIMKNKEQLLSFQEPVSFIFSHSALKEGWDNPNIFQICTLRETRSEMKKRQEIGRGLRLPLDVTGERISDVQINVLTVVANESYEEYVSTLQGEFDEAGYVGNVSVGDARRTKAVKINKKYLSDPGFLVLWDKIKQKSSFSIELDSDKIIDASVRAINGLDLQKIAVTVDQVQIYFDKEKRIQTSFINTVAPVIPRHDVRIGNIIERISKETNLTRSTVYRIIERIVNLESIFDNPEEFVRAVSIYIRQAVEELLVTDSVKYLPKEEYWEINLFKEFDSYLSRLVVSEKSPYTHIEFDSEGEREFAEHLEQSQNVKVYAKLPRGFHIDTPIGEYRPDWAIVWSTNDGDKLYLVRETKFGADGMSKQEIFDGLREEEKKKILWGTEHFKAIGLENFAVATKRDLSDLNT